MLLELAVSSIYSLVEIVLFLEHGACCICVAETLLLNATKVDLKVWRGTCSFPRSGVVLSACLHFYFVAVA
jgi:hypothetical protein